MAREIETVSSSYNVFVEKAAIRDVPQIVDLWAATYVPTYTGVSSDLTEEYLLERVNDKKVRDRISDRFTQRIINVDSSVLFVARYENQIIGYGAAEINDDGIHENSGLYVAEDWRGKGIGRALTKPRVLWHNNLNNTPVNIFLYVAPGTPAVDFHEHLGFKKTGKTNDSVHESGRVVPLIEMRLAILDQHLALGKR
jgi:GNAT superfamily N-acetyltransferase